MELYISVKNKIGEYTQAIIDDPTSDNAHVFKEKIKQLEILVADFEISMRAGITSARSARAEGMLAKMWRRFRK